MRADSQPGHVTQAGTQRPVALRVRAGCSLRPGAGSPPEQTGGEDSGDSVQAGSSGQSPGDTALLSPTLAAAPSLPETSQTPRRDDLSGHIQGATELADSPRTSPGEQDTEQPGSHSPPGSCGSDPAGSPLRALRTPGAACTRPLLGEVWLPRGPCSRPPLLAGV